MGIDGFSMANLTGVNRNMSSQQMANEADAVARQATENEIADVDGISKKQKAGRKDPDAAFNGRMVLIKDEEQNKEEEQEQEEPPKKAEKKEKEPSDEDISKYHFRFKSEGMIEICEGDKVVGTISPEAAARALTNIQDFSGGIVNKKI